jgi:hypothetical protein
LQTQLTSPGPDLRSRRRTHVSQPRRVQQRATAPSAHPRLPARERTQDRAVAPRRGDTRQQSDSERESDAGYGRGQDSTTADDSDSEHADEREDRAVDNAEANPEIHEPSCVKVRCKGQRAQPTDDGECECIRVTVKRTDGDHDLRRRRKRGTAGAEAAARLADKD